MLQIGQISSILESRGEAANSGTRTSPSFQGGAIPIHRDGVVNPEKSQFLGLNHPAPAYAGTAPPQSSWGQALCQKELALNLIEGGEFSN